MLRSETGPDDLKCSVFGDSSQWHQPWCNVQFTQLQLLPATFFNRLVASQITGLNWTSVTLNHISFLTLTGVTLEVYLKIKRTVTLNNITDLSALKTLLETFGYCNEGVVIFRHFKVLLI